MDRAVKTETIVLWACVAFIVIAGVTPITLMAVDSFWQNGRITFERYGELLSSPGFWRLLGNSVGLAAATTAACGFIGIPAGILFAKSDVPLRAAFMWMLTVPFVLPPYFTALGWERLIARVGLSSQWLFGFSGCVLVLSTVFLPIVILFTFASASGVDRRLEEAARLASAWPRVLQKITLPLSAPGIVFSLALVFVLSIGEFSVPNFLRYPVLPVMSFTQFAASYDFGAATAAAIPLMGAAFLGVLAETASLKRRVYAQRSTGQTLRVSLEKWKTAWMLLVAVLCLAIVVSPLGALFSDAFSAAAFSAAFDREGGSIVRSLVYSATAATILMGLGFLVGWFMRERGSLSLSALTLALFSIPGTVLSIGLVRLWNRPSLSLIYATPAMLILGYTAQYCAVTARLSHSGLSAIPASLDEAARLSGASWFRRLGRISVPLSKRALVCSWLAAYILCLRDVPIAMITAPAGHDPLPARILTLMANGAPPMIAALCLIMAAASLIPLWLFVRAMRSLERTP